MYDEPEEPGGLRSVRGLAEMATGRRRPAGTTAPKQPPKDDAEWRRVRAATPHGTDCEQEQRLEWVWSDGLLNALKSGISAECLLN